MAKHRMHLLVCGGTSCRASESDIILSNLRSELNDNGLQNEVQVVMTGCFGLCEKGPIVKVILLLSMKTSLEDLLVRNRIISCIPSLLIVARDIL